MILDKDLKTPVVGVTVQMHGERVFETERTTKQEDPETRLC